MKPQGDMSTHDLNLTKTATNLEIHLNRLHKTRDEKAKKEKEGKKPRREWRRRPRTAGKTPFSSWKQLPSFSKPVRILILSVLTSCMNVYPTKGTNDLL